MNEEIAKLFRAALLAEPMLTAAEASRLFWQFGDIVRVDPAAHPRVPQPDERRWMVLLAASVSAAQPWVLLSLDGGTISHWPNLRGFMRVEE